jgi:hypothetical protein
MYSYIGFRTPKCMEMYSKKNYYRDIREAGSSSGQSSTRPRIPAHKVQCGIACQHMKCGMACGMCVTASEHCVPAHEVWRGVCIACQHTRCGVACASLASTQGVARRVHRLPAHEVWRGVCIACQHTTCSAVCALRAST